MLRKFKHKIQHSIFVLKPQKLISIPIPLGLLSAVGDPTPKYPVYDQQCIRRCLNNNIRFFGVYWQAASIYTLTWIADKDKYQFVFCFLLLK